MQHQLLSHSHNVEITESAIVPVKRKLNEHDENQETIETEDIIYHVKDGYMHRNTPYYIHVTCDCGMEMGYFSTKNSAELAKQIHIQEYENT